MGIFPSWGSGSNMAGLLRGLGSRGVAAHLIPLNARGAKLFTGNDFASLPRESFDGRADLRRHAPAFFLPLTERAFRLAEAAREFGGRPDDASRFVQGVFFGGVHGR